MFNNNLIRRQALEKHISLPPGTPPAHPPLKSLLGSWRLSDLSQTIGLHRQSRQRFLNPPGSWRLWDLVRISHKPHKHFIRRQVFEKHMSLRVDLEERL